MDLAQEFHLAQKLLFKCGSLQNFVSEAERVDWEPVVRETDDMVGNKAVVLGLVLLSQIYEALVLLVECVIVDLEQREGDIV
jgi:hypothetical protein